MPCGGVIGASPLSLRPLSCHRPPAVSAPHVCQAMAALFQQQHHDDVFLENGLLSYENPNYHLDPARLDDAINKNNTMLAPTRTLTLIDAKDSYIVDRFTDNRRKESLNGNEELLHLSDNNSSQILIGKEYEECFVGDNNSTPLEKNCVDLVVSEKDEIPRTPAGPRGELYTVPIRKNKLSSAVDTSTSSEYFDLPPGWEKHEDNDGPYYWHIKSGTIQREPPTDHMSNDGITNAVTREGVMTSSVTRSTTSSALDIECDERKKREDLAFKRRSYPARPEPDAKAIRFFVRSLGWVEIAEEDLTPERSSRAVNKCIVDLSLGRNDLLDVVGRWGDGKDLFMDLDEGALKLIDPENLTTLHTQPIHTIRVWGVGRDNGRDFAYVARDRSTRRHMCHVFRCDMPARTIANTLRDICKRIMIERSLQGPPARPTNLPTEQRRPKTIPVQSFPTPMEEPKKVLRAMYLGSTEVPQATGMDVLNDAIDLLSATIPRDLWKVVNVAVAPSMISIFQQCDDAVVTECRVRYLSFLGIGQDVRRCAFVMHTAQDLFVAHVFHCEPSSGALCKTIEAACKLRYQKCLDAHPGGASLSASLSRSCVNGANSRNCSSSNANSGGGIGATLKSLVGSLTTRKSS